MKTPEPKECLEVWQMHFLLQSDLYGSSNQTWVSNSNSIRIFSIVSIVKYIRVLIQLLFARDNVGPLGRFATLSAQPVTNRISLLLSHSNSAPRRLRQTSTATLRKTCVKTTNMSTFEHTVSFSTIDNANAHSSNMRICLRNYTEGLDANVYPSGYH